MTREELEAQVTKAVRSVAYHPAVSSHVVNKIMQSVDDFNNGKDVQKQQCHNGFEHPSHIWFFGAQGERVCEGHKPFAYDAEMGR